MIHGGKVMQYDDIHFNCNIIDGYNKTFNFIQSARSTGKTTDLFRKAYKFFNKYIYTYQVL